MITGRHRRAQRRFGVLAVPVDDHSAAIPTIPTTARALITSALISLVAILLLAVVLAQQLSGQTAARGKAQAITQAREFAAVNVQPFLTGTGPVTSLSEPGLQQAATLDKVARQAGLLARFRLRTLSGGVLYPAGLTLTGEDDELADAARGEIAAHLTRLNADPGDEGRVGERVVEVYLPVGLSQGKPRAIVELYLAYAPIEAASKAGLMRLYLVLGIGLAGLWILLSFTGLWVSAQLRRVGRRNAWLARYDQLTGLRNRTGFSLELEARLKRGEHGAVLLLDIDRFSEINDTLGPGAGDRVLVALASRLRVAAPGDAVVARLGGDVFGVLVEGVDRDLAESIRTAMSRELVVADMLLSLDLTAGIADTLDAGERLETPEVLRRADVALGAAKKRREGLVIFGAGVDAFDPDRLQLAGELRRAIEEGTLELHYQPKGCLASGGILGAEALLRWPHPVRGNVPPDRFVEVAEGTGLIGPLTDWVLTRAFADVASGVVPRGWDLAINISARNVADPSFPDLVVRRLREAAVSPAQICLEITETALMIDPEQARETLQRLAEVGLRLSLDDFGQGYTSLSQLGHLPVTEIKIDRAFVAGASTRPADAAVVRAVSDLGHALGLEVVAEGVEDAETLLLMRDAGCDGFQGYLLARPLPAAQLATWQPPEGVMPLLTNIPAARTPEQSARFDLFAESAGGQA